PSQRSGAGSGARPAEPPRRVGPEAVAGEPGPVGGANPPPPDRLRRRGPARPALGPRFVRREGRLLRRRDRRGSPEARPRGRRRDRRAPRTVLTLTGLRRRPAPELAARHGYRVGTARGASRAVSAPTPCRRRAPA